MSGIVEAVQICVVNT